MFKHSILFLISFPILLATENPNTQIQANGPTSKDRQARPQNNNNATTIALKQYTKPQTTTKTTQHDSNRKVKTTTTSNPVPKANMRKTTSNHTHILKITSGAKAVQTQNNTGH